MGRGESRRSRNGEVGQGAASRGGRGAARWVKARSVVARLGGQGAARRVKFWSVGVRSGESRLI